MKLVFFFLIEIYSISQSIVFIFHFTIGILLYYLKNNKSMTLMIIIGVLILIVYFVDMITFFILISENYGLLNCFEALFFDCYGVYVLGTIHNDK
jgi:hypothetical protein